MGSPRQVVLLTGASGLLGSWLRRTAPDDVDLVTLVHRTPLDGATSVAADLRDHDATRSAVLEAAPHLVLHAAMAVDQASIVDATASVADAAAEIGAPVLFTSTDAVFSGDGRRRHEGDPPDPIWDYGRWKAAAEGLVAASPAAAWIRLPLVISTDPEDKAVARTRAAAEAGDGIAWFDDELRQPAMAEELAAAIWRIAALPGDERAGPWHLMGPERLTRFAISQRICRSLGLDPATVRPEPTPTGLVRPRDLNLGDDRARHQLGWDPSPVLGG